MIEEFSHPTPDALASALATRFTAELKAAISARGSASLVVSGGRTPRRLFEKLAAAELDWAKVRITLADERLVARNSPDLNANLVREALLQDKAAEAQFFPLWNGTGNARDVAREALSHFAGPFDVLLLGMGDDGHTASLFPGAPCLERALDADNPEPLVFLPETQSRQPRVSLTLSRLLAARGIFLAFEGPGKRAVYERAREAGPATELPIRAVLQKAPKIALYWSTATA